MFDIGFSELVVIGAVALVVIGPEELPRVARTAGQLMGRLRRYVSDVKSDISREMDVSEFKRMQEELEQSAREMRESLSRTAAEFQQSLEREKQEIEGVAVEAQRAIAPPDALEAAVNAATAEAEKPTALAEVAAVEISTEPAVSAPKPARRRKRAAANDESAEAADVVVEPVAEPAPKKRTQRAKAAAVATPEPEVPPVVAAVIAASAPAVVEVEAGEAEEPHVDENQLDMFGGSAAPQSKG